MSERVELKGLTFSENPPSHAKAKDKWTKMPFGLGPLISSAPLILSQSGSAVAKGYLKEIIDVCCLKVC